MKARNLLWITVINIFLLLMISILMEYASLNDTFKQIQNTFSTATDTAIKSSTASEEFFSDKFTSLMTSYATDNGGKEAIAGGIHVLSSDGTEWVSGNVYSLAYFYDDNDRFPSSQSEYNGKVGDLTTREIYKWLYGATGSIYSKYPWANSKTKLWNSVLWTGINSDRTPNQEFKEFYEGIGKYMETSAYIKTRTGSGSFNVEKKTIPTLTQMGLALDNTWNGDDLGGEVTNDYLNSVVHFGKANNGIADTEYYLTPYALGVTYVPTKVLKPVFLAHFEQLVRFNKVKKTVTSNGDLTDFASANGCLDTDVYDNGVQAQHTDSASTDIINDGEVEYDLSTLSVKVDYFLVDFYNNANYQVVNRIEGSTSQYNSSGSVNSNESNSLASLPERLKAKDTSVDGDGNRIVARVSVKMKIHVPYKSSILQWFRKMNGSDVDNHYDIRLWDEGTNSVESDSNGLWFCYTTYTAVSR